MRSGRKMHFDDVEIATFRRELVKLVGASFCGHAATPMTALAKVRMTASGAKRPFIRLVATTKLAVDRQIEDG